MSGFHFGFLCVLITLIGSEGAWVDDPNCGDSIYDDAGEPSTRGRIVGGETTRENELPYQALLMFDSLDRFFCGATLITYKHVITAAHCVEDAGVKWGVTDFQNELRIRVGEHDLTKSSKNVMTRKATTITVHPQYDASIWNNDVAVILMNKAVRAKGGRIRPVCRPNSTMDYTGDKAFVSGWGYMDRIGGQPLPHALQYAALVVLAHEECSQAYETTQYWVTDRMVCTSDEQDEYARDACSGDSGGPMTVKSGGLFRFVGVISWGIGCASGFPGVYTRITSVLDFIDASVP